MSVGVDFILRGNSAGFTRAMANVNNSIKDVKKGLRDFDVGNGLKQALGVGGIIAGFRTAITHAMELRDALEEANRPISDNIATVARYGDALGKVRDGAKDLAVWALSFFTKAGEGWGNLINKIRGISEAEQKMNEETGRAADLAEKRRDEAYKNAKTIISKLTADKKKAAEEEAKILEKKLEEEFEALEKVADAQKKLAEKQKENNRKLMTDEQQLVDLSKELEETNKRIADYKQHQTLSTNDQIRLTELENEASNLGVEIAEKKLAIEEKIAKQKKLAAEAAEAVTKGQAAGLTKAEQDELSLFITSEGKSGRIPTRTGGAVATSADFSRASDAELAEKIRRTQAEVFRLKSNPGSAFEFGNNPAIANQTNILNAALREQAARERIRRDFAVGGETMARQRFQGDPLQFDRVFAAIVKGQTSQDKATDALIRLGDLARRGIPVVLQGDNL